MVVGCQHAGSAASWQPATAFCAPSESGCRQGAPTSERAEKIAPGRCALTILLVGARRPDRSNARGRAGPGSLRGLPDHFVTFGVGIMRRRPDVKKPGAVAAWLRRLWGGNATLEGHKHKRTSRLALELLE